MTHPADHGRFPYSPIHARPDFSWPGGRRLAVYVAVNLECFAFGEAEGAALASSNPAPDVLNHAWRDHGNRVGVWRIIELLDELELPCTVLPNSGMYAEAPAVMNAFRTRGGDVAAHGRTNSEKQGAMDEDAERALIEEATRVLAEHEGRRPTGWLGPWISESHLTPDLLAEAGYRYVLDWAHDEQPVWMSTRGGGRILSVPYPQELNDVPHVVGRKGTAPAFADMIADAYTVHLRECTQRPVVMGVALHPYLMGQAHRFESLARALRGLKERATDAVWFTTATAISEHYAGLDL